jgi:hypothetical protein
MFEKDENVSVETKRVRFPENKEELEQVQEIESSVSFLRGRGCFTKN